MRRRCSLRSKESTPNFEHELEEPKGHRFTIGGDFKTIKAMEQARDPQVQVVKDLVGSNAAVFDDVTPGSGWMSSRSIGGR